MSGTGSIFISYRREDSIYVTGQIYDCLAQTFGSSSIFRDMDGIQLGVDFRKRIDEEVGQCQVLLAVIGKDWLRATNEHGKRRLDDPQDFVRIEIESALQRNIPVIPLLVRSARMPSPGELPESLKEFSYRNGTQVRPDPDFKNDMERLIEELENYLGTSQSVSVRDTAANQTGDQAKIEEPHKQQRNNWKLPIAFAASISLLIGVASLIISRMNSVQYDALERYLASGEWKWADEETDNIIEQITPLTSEGNVSPEGVMRIPCTQLDKIDQLWTQYSEGKFGFNIQNQIWVKAGKDFLKFRKQVGWRDQNGDPAIRQFEPTSAPKGHLPSVDYLRHEFLLPKIKSCNLE